MIEVKNLNFAYRRGLPVLFDISLHIADGEFVALLGHNGSGKTTLSRMLMALDHPRSGQVLVDGQDIAGCEPADLADKIGYVFQNPDLQILEETVFDEVAYGPKAKKLSVSEVHSRTNAALDAMGLRPLSKAYPRMLSFGQKRRLGVAVALALNPRTLILDEITNGQDANEKARMMRYLQAMNREQGMTIILITHDMEVVRRYARRAVVLTDGRLVFDGTPQQLFEGGQPVERWGLVRPVVSVLGAEFGVTARTPAELCAQLVRSGSAQNTTHAMGAQPSPPPAEAEPMAAIVAPAKGGDAL